MHWRHEGIDEIVVLGGDFQPDQRLMAYNLADGAERWWVAGLPPCGKSTPVIGDGLVFCAAPDIIMETAAEQRNPERAAQFYPNNASRVVAVRPGGKGKVNQTNIAWSEHNGTPGVPSPLYYNGHLYTFQNGGILFSRVAKTGELLYSGRLGVPGYYSSPVAADNKVYIASEEGVVVVLDAGEQLKVLATNKLDGAILATPALADGEHLRENRKSSVRFWKIKERKGPQTESSSSLSELRYILPIVSRRDYAWLPSVTAPRLMRTRPQACLMAQRTPD